MSVVVPDSIQPYIGYKWLWVYGHEDERQRLYSGHGSAVWPPFEPLQAVCHYDWGSRWVPREFEHANRLVEDGLLIHTGDCHPQTNEPQQGQLSNGWSNTSLPRQPRILLPPTMAWSWEQREVPADHVVVADNCSCGIYAGSSQDGVRYYTGHALVEVALWGRTVIGSDGARGEFAYPQRILATPVGDNRGRNLAKVYGIPFGKERKPQTAPPEESSETVLVARMQQKKRIKARRLW